jgi:hypothetical protein
MTWDTDSPQFHHHTYILTHNRKMSSDFFYSTLQTSFARHSIPFVGSSDIHSGITPQGFPTISYTPKLTRFVNFF